MPPTVNRTLSRRIAKSRGIIVFGPSQLVVSDGLLRGGTVEEQHVEAMGLPTPWNQVEAGIAVGLSKPVLIIRNSAQGGVFDLPEDPGGLQVIDLSQSGRVMRFENDIVAWLKVLAEQPTGPRSKPEHAAA